MYLINEEGILVMQVGQYGRQVSGTFNGRPGSDPDVHPHFDGNYVGEGGLSQPGRSVKQHVVECLTSAFRRRDGNTQVLFGLFLPDELIKMARPEAGVKGSIFSTGFT
jgi:hypothetical protein